MRNGLSCSLFGGMGAIAAFGLAAGGALAQPTLKIGADTSKVGENIELPLTLDSKDPVQGLTVILEWDADSAVGKDFEYESVIEAGDTVVERIENGFFVLGVVMDADGKDNEIIPAGEDILLGTLVLQCQGDEGSTPVRFVDGKHGSVAGGPVLDNVVVIGGLSIGDEEGLDLEHGSFECEGDEPPAAPTLKIGSDTSKVGEDLRLPLTLDTKDPVQGLTVVLEWDAGSAEGKDFEYEPVVEAGDTVVERIEKGFFVLGVVMDADGKDNEVIPPGEDILLGTLVLECVGNGDTNPVRFVDGKHGSVEGGPALDNVVVIGGESIGDEEGLDLEDGSFRCEDEPDPGEEIDVKVDFRPGTCPNNLNLSSRGVVHVAILGARELDVDDIDVDSIRVEGVEPSDVKKRDVAGGPKGGGDDDDDEGGDDDDDDDEGSDDDDDGDDDDDENSLSRRQGQGNNGQGKGQNDDDDDDEGDDDDDDDGKERCRCVPSGKDGIEDLVLTVSTEDLVRELLEDNEDIESGDCVRVRVTGRLEDDTPFRGEDIVRILGKPRKHDDDDDDDDHKGRGNRHDLNGDGVHDARDIVLRLRLLFEPYAGNARARDVDGDGKVDAQDAVSALRLLFR